MANYAQLGAGPSGNYVDNTGNTAAPGFAGMGMYQPTSQIAIDQGAFNNPVGAAAGQATQNQIQNQLGATTGTGAITAGQGAAAQAGMSQYGAGTQAGAIGGEQALAQQYANMAAGNGPSLATVAAQQQGAANLQSAESMLGSARGSGNPAAAQLAARNAQAQGAQQVAQNAVTGRTQEELGAMQAGGALQGQIAGQGFAQQQLGNQLALQNASQANQVGLGNQQNVLGANTAYSNLVGQQNLAQQQGAIAGQTLNANTQLGQEQVQSQAYANAAKQSGGLFGTIFNGIF